MKFRRVIVLLCLGALLVSMSVAAAGEGGSVTYDGTSQKFIFEPGSDYSPTDLFPGFKDVMPGDSITQKLHIRNETSNKIKIRLYMRSKGAQPGSEDFLSQLKMRVWQDGESNLFDAPADQTAQLTEWTFLGTFYSGADIQLNVALDVPIELGDEYQGAVGYLNWEFKVEELPVEDDDPKPPAETGDSSLVLFAGILVGVSGLALIVLVLLRRKKA